MSICLRQRWILHAIFGAVILLLGGMALLAWPNGPLRQLRERPDVERFLEALNPQAGTGGERRALWSTGAKAATFSKVVETADHENLF